MRIVVYILLLEERNTSLKLIMPGKREYRRPNPKFAATFANLKLKRYSFLRIIKLKNAFFILF